MAQHEPHSPDDPDAAPSEWWKIAGIGFEFAAAVALLTAIGYGVDRWLATGPWGVVVGVACGFALGLVQLVRSAKKMFHD